MTPTPSPDQRPTPPVRPQGRPPARPTRQMGHVANWGPPERFARMLHGVPRRRGTDRRLSSEHRTSPATPTFGSARPLRSRLWTACRLNVSIRQAFTERMRLPSRVKAKPSRARPDGPGLDPVPQPMLLTLSIPPPPWARLDRSVLIEGGVPGPNSISGEFGFGMPPAASHAPVHEKGTFANDRNGPTAHVHSMRFTRPGNGVARCTH